VARILKQPILLLWCAYFLHHADKQIYSVILLPLRQDLGLSAYEAGLASTLFTIVVALISPIAGALGDRWPHHRILTSVVMLWSLGTMATAGAFNLALLLLTRSVVTPAAEAFYPPVSHAYLASLYTRTRALVMSIHQTAQYSGPIVSGFVSGWIAERYGWRYSFLVFGAAGILLSACMHFRLQPTQSQPSQAGLFDGFAFCFRSAPIRAMGFAFAAVLFVSVGYGTFAPSIFVQQFGLSLSQAGLHTTLWSSAAAALGALAGGWISDRWALRGRSRFEPQAVALLCAVPFLWMLGTAQTLPLANAALFGAGFFRGSYEGTLAVALYDLVGPKQRSSAAAVVLLLANLLSAPSAALLGWIADHAELNRAVSLLSLCFVLAAAILLYATRLPSTSLANDVD
jgi:MFS transporter, Spinster family, sphingosine-1-phosphate transporter